jgi:hypothetical protein
LTATATDAVCGSPNRYRVRVRMPAVFLLLLLTAAGFSAVPVSAETIRQREFLPVFPSLIAQGGSSVASVQGYQSLFTNPAGLARDMESRLVIPAMTLWVYSRPDLLLSTIGAFSADEGDSDDDEGDPIYNRLKEQFTTNGFGLGANLGIGWTGNGIGLGLSIASETYLYGDTFPLGLQGEINNQFTFVIGYAQPVEVGPVTLALGGALRPTLRVTSFVDSDTSAQLLSQFLGVDTGDGGDDANPLDTISALNGWGVAFDAGLQATWRPFTLGMQGRNLFNTRMQYSRNSINQIINALGAGGLPSESDTPVDDTYVIPFEFSMGAAWHPDIGTYRAVVEPILHFEIRDVFKTTDQDRERPRSYWTRLHTGAQVRLLNFFDWRIGINQGYATTGFGIDLAFLRVNYAIYSYEFGRYPGDRQVGGAALEFALHF